MLFRIGIQANSPGYIRSRPPSTTGEVAVRHSSKSHSLAIPHPPALMQLACLHACMNKSKTALPYPAKGVKKITAAYRIQIIAADRRCFLSPCCLPPQQLKNTRLEASPSREGQTCASRQCYSICPAVNSASCCSLPRYSSITIF